MGDLGVRVAVAAVGIPAVLAALYYGGWILGAPLALLALLGAGEVYRMAEARGHRPFRMLGMASAAALVASAVLRPSFTDFAPWGLAVILMLAAAALTVALWARGPKGAPLVSVSVTLFGAVYAGFTLAFVVFLHDLPTRAGWGELTPSRWLGALVVVLPLAATWVGDSAAYLAGTAWGRSKLFPSVSPKKSWVGAWAGVAGAAAAGALWLVLVRGALPGLPLAGVTIAAGVGAVLGVGAIVGDLVESLLKRDAGVKDSGSVFPGHGGVLDRLDALAATLPAAYVILVAAEWFA